MTDDYASTSRAQIIACLRCGADIAAQGYMCCPVPDAEDGIEIGIASDPDFEEHL